MNTEKQASAFSDYEHIVSVVVVDGVSKVRIERIIEGRRDFLTEIDFPESSLEERWNAFDRLAEILGKTICIDSPRIRQEIGIDND